ncbi:helix-turn-helix transcriptional regulator [Rhizobium leguminosarum]|uniref:helix-turn-helix domain-containing protein n=1 Tax=Rhizobium leguminosarum TaxID=384 RepID=UPI001C97474A|nr:helix-turn-helix transcriptional regulator [Rhizobium leguminosarum]MBY5904741.1 helix-turn-helix transcriptional regulator [Rhizobium leguminosarum]MBY5911832.1 helix-turn-helix transcriptional regulator [Rhizobium leguminosarum]MBY5919262.1 helix-turn-helix transcriptional regulator [Rhizobium leguminosarum]
MPDTALGFWLKGLREERKLSLRDLGQRSEVDHAYIHRLETGVKEAPSEEVLDKLAKALSASNRDRDILRHLARQTNVDPNILEFVHKDQSISADELQMLSTVVNRGARADYATSLARIRRMMMEDDDG